MLDPSEVPAEAAEVLACCQSLVLVDGELIGDPLEKAALQVRAAAQATQLYDTPSCCGRSPQYHATDTICGVVQTVLQPR